MKQSILISTLCSLLITACGDGVVSKDDTATVSSTVIASEATPVSKPEVGLYFEKPTYTSSGPWQRTTHLENAQIGPQGLDWQRETSNSPTPSDEMVDDDPTPIDPIFFDYDDNPIRLVLNGLDALTEKVIPTLAEDEGLTSIEVNDTTEHRDFACWRVRGTMKDVSVELPFDEDTVQANFLDDNGLHLQADVQSDIGVTLEFDLDRISNSALCRVVDRLLGGFDDWSESLTLQIDEVGVAADVTLDVVSNAVTITDVDALEVELELDISGTDTAQWLVDVSESIYGYYTGCSDTSECLSELLADTLGSDPGEDYEDVDMKVGQSLSQLIFGGSSFEDKLLATINDAIDLAIRLDDDSSLSAIGASFAVELDELDTDENDNRLSAIFPVALNVNNSAECAEGLTWSAPVLDAPLATRGAVDLQIPNWIISKSVYALAQKGDFCTQATFSYGATSGSVTLVPDGEITVQHSPSVIPRATSPGTISVTVPTLLSLDGNFSGDLTADLKIKVELSLEDDDVYLVYTSVTLENLSGTIMIGSYAVSSSLLESTLDTALATAIGDLSDERLFSRVTQFGSIGTVDYSLELVSTRMNDSYTTLGINLVAAEQAPTAEIYWSSDDSKSTTSEGPVVYRIINGCTSSDPNGDELTYSWSLSRKPTGSSATVDSGRDGEATCNATLATDLAGYYTVKLVVSDGTYSSEPDYVYLYVSSEDSSGRKDDGPVDGLERLER